MRVRKQTGGIKWHILYFVCFCFAVFTLEIYVSNFKHLIDKASLKYKGYNALSYININFTKFIGKSSKTSCLKGTTMLIAAYSHPKDVLARQAIRNTWANAQVRENFHVTIIFPIGLPLNETVHRQLVHEYRLYGDLVQGDFLDTYDNLTYKGIAVLKWASIFCKSVPFFLKVDLDVFVNTPILVPFLEKKYSTESHFMACQMLWRSLVLRPDRWCDKWCVSKEDYTQDMYPPYCHGSFYVISGDVIAPLLNASNHVPLWWVADVYLTGILPQSMSTIVKRIPFTQYLT